MNFVKYCTYILITLACLSDRTILSGRSGFPKDSSGLDTILSCPGLVNRFYLDRKEQLFWFSNGRGSAELRATLKACIDSGDYLGLEPADYHYSTLRQFANRIPEGEDSLTPLQADKIFTDAAIMYGRDLFRGQGMASWVHSDQFSPDRSFPEDTALATKLSRTYSTSGLRELFNDIEPDDSVYRLLRADLKEWKIRNKVAESRKLSVTLNHWRWIHHFHFDRFILVNIPSATLQYYKGDSLRLQMKVVLGKPSTPTPRFAAYCNEIILYPYWNVPRKIAVNEFLPLFKKNPNAVNLMNMQVMDSRGKVLDPVRLPWARFTRENFPYQLRQSTGCDNALGVVKFNLTSPFDVYMHDTNFKLAFLSDRRYYSHGCIRLEKPIELANLLLKEKLDSTFLVSCLRDQQPVYRHLEKPVPVFVVYMPVQVTDSAHLAWFPDIYRLLQ